MNAIRLKTFDEVIRLKNTLKYNRGLENAAVRQWRENRKGDKEIAAEAKAEAKRLEQVSAELQARLTEAEDADRRLSMECSIKRTMVIVMADVLDYYVFELRDFLRRHAASDGGEVAYLEEIRRCTDVLRRLPEEFAKNYPDTYDDLNDIEDEMVKQITAGTKEALEYLLNEKIGK